VAGTKTVLQHGYTVEVTLIDNDHTFPPVAVDSVEYVPGKSGGLILRDGGEDGPIVMVVEDSFDPRIKYFEGRHMDLYIDWTNGGMDRSASVIVRGLWVT